MPHAGARTDGPSTSGAEDQAEVVGERTREERDEEGRKRAIDVDVNVDAEAATKVAKTPAVKLEPKQEAQPRTASPQGKAALSVKQKADAIAEELGILGEPLWSVAKMASSELGVHTDGLSISEQIARCHSQLLA